MMTSIDLLLSLGGKLADILASLLSRKMDDKEKEQARELVQQYSKIKDTHLQVSTVVEKYNQEVVRAVSTKSLQELFTLCTHNGYQHVNRLYRYYEDEGVVQLMLEKLEVLSINLTTYQVQELKFLASNHTTSQRAQVYTVESWIVSYEQGGRQHSKDVINRYSLECESGLWKLDSVEVFSKK